MYTSKLCIHLSIVPPDNMSNKVVGLRFGSWVINRKDEKREEGGTWSSPGVTDSEGRNTSNQ